MAKANLSEAIRGVIEAIPKAELESTKPDDIFSKLQDLPKLQEKVRNKEGQVRPTVRTLVSKFLVRRKRSLLGASETSKVRITKSSASNKPASLIAYELIAACRGDLDQAKAVIDDIGAILRMHNDG